MSNTVTDYCCGLLKEKGACTCRCHSPPEHELVLRQDTEGRARPYCTTHSRWLLACLQGRD